MVRSGGRLQPASNLDRASGQRGPERPPEGGDTTSRRSIVWQHEKPRDCLGVPIPLAGDLAGEPSLPVERDEHGLQVGNHGLDLDDQQRTGRWMEREHVDRPTLPTNRERHLDRRTPAGADQQLEGRIHERGVSLIQQSVQALAIPEQADFNATAKLRSHAIERPHGHPIRPSSLEATDRRRRESRPGGELRLGPLASSPEGTNAESEPDRIHPRSMTRGDWLGLNQARPRRSAGGGRSRRPRSRGSRPARRAARPLRTARTSGRRRSPPRRTT